MSSAADVDVFDVELAVYWLCVAVLFSGVLMGSRYYASAKSAVFKPKRYAVLNGFNVSMALLAGFAAYRVRLLGPWSVEINRVELCLFAVLRVARLAHWALLFSDRCSAAAATSVVVVLLQLVVTYQFAVLNALAGVLMSIESVYTLYLVALTFSVWAKNGAMHLLASEQVAALRPRRAAPEQPDLGVPMFMTREQMARRAQLKYTA